MLEEAREELKLAAEEWLTATIVALIGDGEREEIEFSPLPEIHWNDEGTEKENELFVEEEEEEEEEDDDDEDGDSCD